MDLVAYAELLPLLQARRVIFDLDSPRLAYLPFYLFYFLNKHFFIE
jgi:hypothetical protein